MFLRGLDGREQSLAPWAGTGESLGHVIGDTSGIHLLRVRRLRL